MTILSTTSDSDSKSSIDWENYRQNHFPITNRWRYFDHAAVSPLPTRARDAIAKWLKEATEEGDTVWPTWAARVEEIRQTAANLVNADKSEIAMVPSTSFGISLVAQGLDWQTGDNIVIPAGEFPSNLYPWMDLESRGVELRTVPTGEKGEFTVDAIEQACDSRTRLVSTSWVGYASGFRIDPAEIAEVAHRYDAYYFLDAIQGLGVFPLDVKNCGIDFFAADGHKWMMGPEGAGIFFCRQELLEAIQPRVIGWNSVEMAHDFSTINLSLKKNASRFEAGTQNMAGIMGLGGSLDLITDVGVTCEASPIANRVLDLGQHLIESMQALGWTSKSIEQDVHRSGIVSFDHPDIDPSAARTRLMDEKVVTSVRNRCLRFSAHAYNNAADIDHAIDVLKEF